MQNDFVASRVLMVRPASFGFNRETAANNSFQQDIVFDSLEENVLLEFDGMVSQLQSLGIEVVVIQDEPGAARPDAIFPNNWFSTHRDTETLFIYPMFSPMRRLERSKNIISEVQRITGITEVTDLSHFENSGKYLEGTGSLVLDRKNKFAYACQSPRTNEELFYLWCEIAGYKPFFFSAYDDSGLPVYHTNVLMNIGPGYTCVCLDAVTGSKDREMLINAFRQSALEIIEISRPELNAFAGNMLHLQNRKFDQFIVLSEAAFRILNKRSIEKLQRFGQLIPINIRVIEAVGGGSVRCMMAELF